MWRKGDLRSIRKERRELAALQSKDRPVDDTPSERAGKEEESQRRKAQEAEEVAEEDS